MEQPTKQSQMYITKGLIKLDLSEHGTVNKTITKVPLKGLQVEAER